MNLDDERFLDREWRLNNLYWITDEDGNVTKFRMKAQQLQLLRELWYFNVILKARQIGFSTFIQIFMLDECLIKGNTRCGVIAHNKEDAEHLFRDKIKFAYDNLPGWLKEARPASTDKVNEILFDNNSSIRVGTSMRSGTLQYLHVSEYGKIAAKFPEKAREIKTGSFNTVSPGNIIFVESTAEGVDGEFFDLCQRAQTLQQMGKKLNPREPKFFFFPWYNEQKYQLKGDIERIPEEMREYFNREYAAKGISLSDEQRIWYYTMSQEQGDLMKREYPATPEEAFEASIEGTYFGTHMAKAAMEGRIGKVPHRPELDVETWWDLGVNDTTCIWFAQRDRGGGVYLIDYYENAGEGMEFYSQVMRQKAQQRQFNYSKHWLPHDAAAALQGAVVTNRREILQELWPDVKCEVVPRVKDKNVAIQAARSLIPKCYFDETHTIQGVNHLRMYRKDWDDIRGVFKNQPRHDDASHGADAFMTGAMAQAPKHKRKPEKRAAQVAMV